MHYKTIKDNVEYTEIIKKSIFTAYLFNVESKEQVDDYLSSISKKHYDATHVCYAYILYNDSQPIFKSNDDGEPAGTAGVPILNALKQKQLSNILCIVVRYFKGIKLGAGGLIRAYGGICSQAVENAHTISKKQCEVYQISFSYSNVKLMDRALESLSAIIVSKVFDMQVIYEVIVKQKEDIKKLNDSFASTLDIKHLGNKMIEIENECL